MCDRWKWRRLSDEALEDQCKEHSASVVLSWCALLTFLGRKCVNGYSTTFKYLVTKANELTKWCKIMAITPFRVIQGHRFWYQSWLTLTYLPSCTVFKLWLIICQIFATNRGSRHFNALAGVIPCEYRHKWYIVKNRFLGLHFTRRMYRSIFNHFYVIGPKS